MANNSQFDNGPDKSEASLNARLLRHARTFQYPPTPDIAGRMTQKLQQRPDHRRDGRDEITFGSPPGQRSRRVARNWVFGVGLALAGAALLAGLILVTPARARVAEWLRLGAVRLFLDQSATPVETVQPEALTGLAGETTLPQARERVPFPLRLPGYPPDLKEPQHVFVQQINGVSVVIMVWLRQGSPQEVRLALFQIGKGDVFQKQLIHNVQETSVNGQWALWVTGPYLLSTTGGTVEERVIVQGHTLIWSAQGLTYRLETDLQLDEARKIAESLKE